VNIQREGYRQPTLPMLANKYSFRTIKKWKSCMVMPKLDGVRGLTTKVNVTKTDPATGISTQGVSAICTSRNNKEFPFLDGIKNEMLRLFDLLPPGWKPDGEFYNHQLDLQQIVSRAMKKKNKSETEGFLGYYLFDIVPTSNISFRDRFRVLMDAYEKLKNELKLIYIVPCYEITGDKETWDAQIKYYHSEFVKAGYEGVIVRNPESEYVGSRRSHLLKYKEFIDQEFQIVDFKVAEGSHEGCVVWKCQMPMPETDPSVTSHLTYYNDMLRSKSHELQILKNQQPSQNVSQATIDEKIKSMENDMMQVSSYITNIQMQYGLTTKYFDVVPKWTLEARRKAAQLASQYIGKPLTVRYQTLTQDGIPQFPIGIGIRDYE
jgi:hypothetical protein